MAAPPSLYLGASRSLDGQEASALQLPAHHLTTHAVVVGMTGSGKTGLLTVMVEEALRQSVPVLMIDIKGDLPNLLLAFPNFAPELVEPWVEPAPAILALPPRSPASSANNANTVSKPGTSARKSSTASTPASTCKSSPPAAPRARRYTSYPRSNTRSRTGRPIPTLPEPPCLRPCRSYCGCSAATRIPPRAATTS